MRASQSRDWEARPLETTLVALITVVGRVSPGTHVARRASLGSASSSLWGKPVESVDSFMFCRGSQTLASFGRPCLAP